MTVLWLLWGGGQGRATLDSSYHSRNSESRLRGLFHATIRRYFGFPLERSTMYIGFEIQGNHFKVIGPQLCLLRFPQKITVIRDHNECHIIMLKKPFENF